MGRGSDLHAVVFERNIGNDAIQTILGGILAHDSHRQNDWDVIGGLERKNAQVPHLEEVRVAGALYSALNYAGPAIVGGYCQMPVPELLVQVAQMPRGGTSGLFRVEPVIIIACLIQAVFPAPPGNELPHAPGGLPRPGPR